MRDPDLVVRAQLAASALEGAWRRWRVVHSDMADPMPAISSYVGYSLQEPWGQPRVVFGIAAEDAEQLAALIERHDGGDPAYAAAAVKPGVRDLPARAATQARPVPVPRQLPLGVARTRVGQPLADVLPADENLDYDEPLYRQAAAAMKEAAAAREAASRANPDGAEPADARLSRDDGASISADRSEQAIPDWMGTLAKAASTARAEAEARIRATLTEFDAKPAEASASDVSDSGVAGEHLIAAESRDAVIDDVQVADADRGQDSGVDDREAVGEGVTRAGVLDDVQSAGADDLAAGAEDGRVESPQIYATDVLEPLPRPAGDAGADVADIEESAEALMQDDQDRGALDQDAGDGAAGDQHGG